MTPSYESPRLPGPVPRSTLFLTQGLQGGGMCKNPFPGPSDFMTFFSGAWCARTKRICRPCLRKVADVFLELLHLRSHILKDLGSGGRTEICARRKEQKQLLIRGTWSESGPFPPEPSWMDCSVVWCSLRLMRSCSKVILGVTGAAKRERAQGAMM